MNATLHDRQAKHVKRALGFLHHKFWMPKPDSPIYGEWATGSKYINRWEYGRKSGKMLALPFSALNEEEMQALVSIMRRNGVDINILTHMMEYWGGLVSEPLEFYSVHYERWPDELKH